MEDPKNLGRKNNKTCIFPIQYSYIYPSTEYIVHPLTLVFALAAMRSEPVQDDWVKYSK